MRFSSALLLCSLSIAACKTDLPEPTADLAAKKTRIDEQEAAAAAFARIVDQPGGKTALSGTELQTLYQSAIQQPVAKLQRVSHYDPEGIIGFCFGRSMAAHLIARNAGLKPTSVFKLFILGDLRSESFSAPNPEWYFHVTTVVLGPKNVWYAIDPIMYNGGKFQPLTADQWINAVTKGWDSTKGRPAKAKFYLVDSNAVMPDIRNLPPFSQETGKFFIETNYDPKAKGITRSSTWERNLKVPVATKARFFAPNALQTVANFLVTKARGPNAFHFLKIELDTTTISYNNYFVDLLSSDLNPIGGKKALGLEDTDLATEETVTDQPDIPPEAEGWLGGFRYQPSP